MKTFSLLEAPSEKFVEIAFEKIGGNPRKDTHDIHPQEDFLLTSDQHPIFVVADGVTLIQYIIDKEPYPHPSPSGDVARIFCQEFIKAAESKYGSFTEVDIKICFSEANKAVQKYNEKLGRTKDTIDYWKNDLYAATAAFVVIKDNHVYWGSICDSYVMHLEKDKVIFSSPACNSLIETEPPSFTGNPNDKKAETIFTWKTKRNGINEQGKRVGYGVVTGEPEATNYLCSGAFEIKDGDSIVLLTDGFEDYMKLPEFTKLLADSSSTLETQIKDFTSKKAEEDPETFGHERTLIAVKY